MDLVQDSSDSTYECSVCKSIFPNSLDLLYHQQMHEEVELAMNYKCNECGARFALERQLNRHILSHSEELKPFKCKECGTRFKLKKHLDIHVRKHDMNRPYYCQQCGYRYEQNTQLQSHMKSHEDIRPFVCDICHSAFKRSYDMKVHRSTHSEDKPFHCQECGADFKKLAYLNKHKKTHTKERFSCGLCGAMFKEKRALVGHVHLHNREKSKSFVCHVCEKNLPTAKELQDHVKSHPVSSHLPKTKEDKMYHCHECSCNFKAAKPFELHKSLQHDGETPFQCQFCQANFTKDMYLTIHIMKHEDKNIYCDCCKTFCESEYEMGVHEWQHVIDQLQAIEALEESESIYEENSLSMSVEEDLSYSGQSELIPKGSEYQRYNCQYCGCSFNLLKPLELHRELQHKGEMTFECLLCSARFNEARFLNVHVYKHMEKKVPCNRCKISCNSEYELGIHDCQEEQEKLGFHCDNCGCSFTGTNPYELHYKLQHKGVAPYTCQWCKATFTLEKFLNIHKYKHTSKLITCVRCNSVCNSEYEAGNHFWHHVVLDSQNTSVKPINSEYEMGNSVRHHVVDSPHLSVKPSNFSQNKHMTPKLNPGPSRYSLPLKGPVNILNKPRRYHCDNCGCTFDFLKPFQLHVELQHFGECNKFGCISCPATFTKEIFLNIHALKHLEKHRECSVCKQVCQSEYEAGIHDWLHHLTDLRPEDESTQSSEVEITPKILNSTLPNKSTSKRRRKVTRQNSSFMDKTNAVDSGELRKAKTEESGAKRKTSMDESEEISSLIVVSSSKVGRTQSSKPGLDITSKNDTLSSANKSKKRLKKQIIPRQITLMDKMNVFHCKDFTKIKGVLVSNEKLDQALEILSPGVAKDKTVKESIVALNSLHQSDIKVSPQIMEQQLDLKQGIKPCFVKLERISKDSYKPCENFKRLSHSEFDV